MGHGHIPLELSRRKNPSSREGGYDMVWDGFLIATYSPSQVGSTSAIQEQPFSRPFISELHVYLILLVSG